MTEDEQRAAAYRWAVNTFDLVTEDAIRSHLGVERGQADLDVQNVRYYVQTAEVVIPAAADGSGGSDPDGPREHAEEPETEQ